MVTVFEVNGFCKYLHDYIIYSIELWMQSYQLFPFNH